jgi:hypothetical protein
MHHPVATLETYQLRRGNAEGRFICMFDVIGVAMLGGMVAMVFYELYKNVRERKDGLHDHYHP